MTNPKRFSPEAKERPGMRPAAEDVSAKPSHEDEPPSADPGLEGPWRAIVLTLATGFGTGLSPLASGTAGTLIAIPIYWFLSPPYGGWLAYLAATIVLCVAAVGVAGAAEGVLQKKDDGRVVIDEIVGFLVAMLWVPHGFWTVFFGFLLFRFFDVAKPAPARQLQSLKGGWGIVVDDLIAGVYACLSLHVLRGFWLLVF